MTHFFVCSYLGAEVELTEERERHITDTHPGTLPNYLEELAETLASPDQIRQSERDSTALLFSKWFDQIRTGRHLVVVVVAPAEPKRYWVITAYTARKITGGVTVWTRA